MLLARVCSIAAVVRRNKFHVRIYNCLLKAFSSSVIVICNVFEVCNKTFLFLLFIGISVATKNATMESKCTMDFIRSARIFDLPQWLRIKFWLSAAVLAVTVANCPMNEESLCDPWCTSFCIGAPIPCMCLRCPNRNDSHRCHYGCAQSGWTALSTGPLDSGLHRSHAKSSWVDQQPACKNRISSWTKFTLQNAHAGEYYLPSVTIWWSTRFIWPTHNKISLSFCTRCLRFSVKNCNCFSAGLSNIVSSVLLSIRRCWMSL